MRYEVLKIFGNIKILLVIVCMFILSIVMAMKTDTIMFEGFNTNVYKYYMERLEGEYTQEKYDYVIDEYKRMQEHIANSDLYDEQYRNKLISAMEYRELSSAVDLAKSRIKTFEYIVSKTEYYSQCENAPSFFYDIDVEDYIVNMGVNIPLILSLILVICAVFVEDYMANTVYMIRSSRDGKKRLLCRRILLTVIVAVLASAIFYIGEFLAKYFYLDLGMLEGNIESLMNVQAANYEGTILGFIIMSIGIRTLYTVVIAMLISTIALLTHKYMMTVGISLAVIFLPKAFMDSKWLATAGLEGYTLLKEDVYIGNNAPILVIMVYLMITVVWVGVLIKRESR